VPRRHRGHPGETERPANADHEAPTPAGLLQIWVTGQPRAGETTGPGEPEAVANGLGVPASVAAAALGVEHTASEDDGPVIPHHVEYTPRAPYGRLLGILFVVASVLAVVAIFWAVSQGGQSSIGIAIGVTGFALAFWWGLLSWTPTVVSVNGPILEVACGADDERFDLRSPELDIDVDHDTASGSWRATITRPDDTKLVILATAVDPGQFTAIVQHYRGPVQREDQPPDVAPSP
jgi:hypothetical protein